MLVPPEDRLGVVESIEARIVETYADSKANTRDLDVVHPPMQRAGHVEQVVTTVTVREGSSIEPRARAKRAPG